MTFAVRDVVVPSAVVGPSVYHTVWFGLYHEDETALTDAEIDVDISGLKGVAEVTWPEECSPDGDTAVCKVEEVATGEWAMHRLELRVEAAAGARDGVSGDITYTGRAGEMTAQPGHTVVTVGSGPDLVVPRLLEQHGVQPRDIVNRSLPFTNTGNAVVKGVKLTMSFSGGLLVLDRYRNCSYTNDSPDPGITTVECVVDGDFEPGQSYALDAPIRLRVADFGLYEFFGYRVEEEAWSGGEGSGADQILKFVRNSSVLRSMKRVDLNVGDNDSSSPIIVANTADFEVIGAKVEGGVGDQVEAMVQIRNHGPAWVTSLLSSEHISTIAVRIPEGTTVVAKPARCRARTASGGWFEGDLGAPVYWCSTDKILRPGANAKFPLTLRIDKVIQAVAGTISFMQDKPYGNALGFDPEQANNVSEILVNSKVGGDSSAGSAGSGDVTGAGSTASASGDPGSTGATGSSTAGGSSSVDSDPGQNPEGVGSGSSSSESLAASGSPAIDLLVGAAGGAVLLGSAAVSAVRTRRKRLN